jgi:hypothetical protein
MSGILGLYQQSRIWFQVAGGYNEHIYPPTDAVLTARKLSLARREQGLRRGESSAPPIYGCPGRSLLGCPTDYV